MPNEATEHSKPSLETLPCDVMWMQTLNMEDFCKKISVNACKHFVYFQDNGMTEINDLYL